MTFPFNEAVDRAAKQYAAPELGVLQELLGRYAKIADSADEEQQNEAGMMVVECINMIYQKLVHDGKVSEEDAESYTQYLILDFMQQAIGK